MFRHFGCHFSGCVLTLVVEKNVDTQFVPVVVLVHTGVDSQARWGGGCGWLLVTFAGVHAGRTQGAEGRVTVLAVLSAILERASQLHRRVGAAVEMACSQTEQRPCASQRGRLPPRRLVH